MVAKFPSSQHSPSSLAVRDGHHAHGGDGEQIVGGGAHDGAGPKWVRLKSFTDNSDNSQTYFRGGGA